MTDTPKPKYDVQEMIVLRTLAEVGHPCTAGTVASTLLASGSDMKLTEEMAEQILERVVRIGGAKKEGVNGYVITTTGTSDLGPLMERKLGSFKDEDDSPTGYERV